ncbi:hypothetical protein ACOMHN_017536 [Nucella lapillus]
MFISADGGTHWGTNNTYANTTAGPLKLTDFCPGIEYLIHQNNTNTTFLQVNVTDCEDSGLKPTAHQGVVYGVCEDLTTFCILHIQAPQANAVYTSYLKIEFSKGYRNSEHRFIKIYVSTLSTNNQSVKLPSGLFNCSVNDYSELQQHLDCNLETQCEDGRDETEHCAFSSPHCQGLVASHNKCFQLIYLQTWTPPTLSQHECHRIDGRVASIKTRKEQEDFLNIYKSYLEWFKYEDRQQWAYVNLDGTGYFTRHVISADQLCPDSHYPCQVESLYCLPVYTRCNGFADCVHGEDEQQFHFFLDYHTGAWRVSLACVVWPCSMAILLDNTSGGLQSL